MNLTLRNLFGSFTMSILNVSEMRIPYRKDRDNFDIIDLKYKEPIGQFKSWFLEAVQCPDVLEANAMALATASKDGIPSVRNVLFKGLDDLGFHFYTNYDSRKGKELIENPYASLLFYWEPLHRQIRVEGTVKKLPELFSDNYFLSRPEISKISAAISPQSQPIESRQFLESLVSAKEKEVLNGKPIVRPNNWGGFAVQPRRVEFWQGQTNRLHDRIVFRRKEEADDNNADRFAQVGENGWLYERLAP